MELCQGDGAMVGKREGASLSSFVGAIDGNAVNTPVVALMLIAVRVSVPRTSLKLIRN